ncbi:MAG: S41 family peptidase [Burkholderiaceae bacterium]
MQPSTVPLRAIPRRQSESRARRLLWPALAVALGVAACGGGAEAPASPGATDKVSYLIETMRSWYLWNTRLPDPIDPGAYTDENQALDALRVTEDRYSNIADASEYQRFYGEGKSVAFGILYRVRTDDLLLLMVSPNSPGHAAGLRRSQRILAIDGESITLLQAQNRLDAAFGPAEPGIMRRFTIADELGQRDIIVTKALFDIAYVIAEGLFVRGQRRIGYVHFYSFADPGVAPWQAALDRLIAAGAQDLIVDLRTNGGGLLATAATIGSSLGDMAGKTMATLRFNDAHSSSNRAYLFRADERGNRFERLVWLTDANTCSAAESLILGVAPWRPATRIGATSCGKPVGFTPSTFQDKVFNIVSFSLENALGVTNYFTGLAPDCTVADDGRGQFGEADETLTAAALSWLDTGSCPAIAQSATPKSGSGEQAPASTRRGGWPDPPTMMR